ncbi:MAG TPA: twin-arginine translocase TatA/TatE family subunit [Candidatus Kapabacteria bacterium]|nr:twin-arginine translocase TatA/TatE family subunit [Candidatus Kapabacteria bacterium]
MFDIGSGELLLILIVVLIAFGPRKLPELAQSLGRGIREFKKAQREFTDQINTAIQQEERRQSRASAAPPVQSTVQRGPIASVAAPLESFNSPVPVVHEPALVHESQPSVETHNIAPPVAMEGHAVGQAIPHVPVQPAPLPPDDATIGQIHMPVVERPDGSQLGFFPEGDGARTPA